ncbi:MAG TPA: hypothetical protein VK184_21585 [Nostocaceae cyanobacterium]|nr:hypothetical protein [Nostocaceae cyanobacterium]
MSRKKVDLTTLPIWLQYSISLTVVAIVVTFAWFVGRNNPIPAWITTYLIPILGWSYIILFIFVITSRIFQKK